MRILLILLVFFTSCVSREQKIKKRLKTVQSETIRLIEEYAKKYPEGRKPSTEEMVLIMDKMSRLKKEKDSLQTVLDERAK